MAKAVRRLPRSLAQWLPTTGQHPNPPPSRLAHVLLRHFPPPHPAGQHPHEHSESGSSNPRIAPYAALALPTTQQQVQTTQLEPRQKQAGGRRAAKAAGALLRGSAVGGAASGGAPTGPNHPAWVAAREGVGPALGRVPFVERRPQSAGSDAAPAAKGKPAAAKGRAKGSARSVSPNSQYYQFSCTSSVPDHGSSCCGDAASVALQDWSSMSKGTSEPDKRKVDLGRGKCKGNSDLGIGRKAAQGSAQLSSWQPEGGSSPVHTTYVLPYQHDMLPRCMPEASEVPLGYRSEQDAVSRQPQQQQQQQVFNRGGRGSYMQQPSFSARLRSSPGGFT